MSEVKSQSDTNAEMGPVAKLAEDEDYDEIISLYDAIDEEEVCGYEDLEMSTVAAAPRPSVYVGLAKAQTAESDTSDSTEHVDDDDNNDQDQVSKPTLKIIGKEFPDLL